MDNLLIYGGTFDPVHLGHVEVLKAVQKFMHFDAIKLIPCKIPLLKDPTQAPIQARLDMLNLILPEIEHASIDTIELDRDTPSYTFNTLLELQKNHAKPTACTLLLGEDAFAQLPQWHQWEKLLTVCHILVVERPPALPCTSSSRSTKAPTPRGLSAGSIGARHETKNHQDLKTKPHGCLYFFNAGHYPIASTDIRKKLAMGLNCDDILPKKISAYIKNQHLYQALP